MSGFVAHLCQDAAKQRHVLCRAASGLRIVYDGGGLEPSVTVNSPDGEIEFVGAAEIRAAASAMRSATRYAEAFGPPVPLLQWRQLNG